MSARICTRSFASRFESGSSIRNTCGWRTIARPIATRWRWPPESSFGRRSRYGVRSSIFAAQATRSLIDALRRLAQAQPEGDVLGDGQVRVERVVLEDHRDVALLRRHVVDDAAADRDRAVGDVLEPGDHAQRGRLAAARRADEHEELAVRDVERQVEDGLHAVVVDLVDFVERDVSHVSSPNSPDVEGGTVAGRTAVAVERVAAVERLEPLRRAASDDRRRAPRARRGTSSRSSRVSRRYAIASAPTCA